MSLVSFPTLKTRSIVTTNADLLNAVVLQIDGVRFVSGSIITDSAYNGNISVQIQKQNGTWDNAISINNPSSSINIMCGSFDGSGFGNLLVSSGLEKFPYSIRVIVTLKATTGTGTIKMVFE